MLEEITNVAPNEPHSAAFASGLRCQQGCSACNSMYVCSAYAYIVLRLGKGLPARERNVLRQAASACTRRGMAHGRKAILEDRALFEDRAGADAARERASQCRNFRTRRVNFAIERDRS